MTGACHCERDEAAAPVQADFDAIVSRRSQ
jgi:hypothetical protein